MPGPRPKRKADDGPFAVSGLKRTAPSINGANGHTPYPSREQRERDGYAIASSREREWYDKYGSLSAYEKESSHNMVSSKRRKADYSSGATPSYYASGMGGNQMIRGEDGPLITLEMATLPTPALLKYLQTYNLLHPIYPSPQSAQRPSDPKTALLKGPVTSADDTATVARMHHSGKYGQSGWDGMDVQMGSMKTATKGSLANGMATSTLGLSGAELGAAQVVDTTAMCDVDEARSTLVTMAQNHWNSMSSAFAGPNSHTGYGGRLNERDVIDDFIIALRAKELAIRLST